MALLYSPNDFRFSKMASSIESDRGATIMNALSDFQRQEELVSIAFCFIYVSITKCDTCI